MKRRTLKSIACATAIALALSVTACGGSKDSANDTDTTEVEDTVDAEEPEEVNNDEADAEVSEVADAEEEADAGDEWETLEDFFSDPEAKAQVEEAYAAFAPEGASVTIDAVGNEFIINFKFEDDSLLSQLGEDTVEILEESLDSYAGQFEAAAAQFDEAIGEEGGSAITVRYLDPDDNVLAEQTYTAK